jgi:glycosyltransferase involved in cell wall biosynthesis
MDNPGTSDKRRKRIVVFAPHYASYAVHLSRALADKADVLLLLERAYKRAECGPGSLTLVPDSLRVVEFNSRGRPARLVSTFKILTEVLSFRPDIINIQEEEGRFTAWITRFIRRMAPILLTVHDPSPHTGADAAYAAANVASLTSIRAAASAFHVHGAYCRDALIAEVGSSRPIFVSQHGVLFERADIWRLEPERGRVLMFGRMEAYKGLDVLIDAADILRKRNVIIRLVLAGRGPEIDRLALRIANRPDIELINTFLTVDEVGDQLQRAAIVVLPYLNATQSGVIAAAFGNDRPVIASRTGGLVDAVKDGENGILVQSGDAQILADAIETVLADNLLLARLSEGAAHARKTDFAWPVIGDAMVRFIRQNHLTKRS